MKNLVRGCLFFAGRGGILKSIGIKNIQKMRQNLSDCTSKRPHEDFEKIDLMVLIGIVIFFFQKYGQENLKCEVTKGGSTKESASFGESPLLLGSLNELGLNSKFWKKNSKIVQKNDFFFFVANFDKYFVCLKIYIMK